MDFIICPVCGHKLEKRLQDGRNRPVCGECGYIQYKNPLPAAAVLLVKDEKILLVKRRYAPKMGDWTLPAGFIEYDETPEGAALRETLEETGLNVRIKKLLKVTGTCEDHTTNVILIIYEVEWIDGELKPGDDALEAGFFAVHELPKNIAFSSHKKAIREYLDAC